MVYPLFCTKLLIIFGKNYQTSILNLLPHLQDPIWNTGWITTQTCTLSYNILITSIQHTTISQQSTCGIMQITLINVTQIYICGCSEKFSASTIAGNTIGKIFFPKLVHVITIHMKLQVILPSSLFYTAV